MTNAKLIPVTVGALDVSVILAYALGVSPPSWYIGVLALKAALAVSYARRLEITSRQLIFIGAVLISITPGTLMNIYSGDGLTRVFGFCAQLLLTSALLGSDGLARYLKTVAGAISISSAAHASLCLFDLIPDQFGRYLYFGGNHPNLGAEIGVMGVLAAAMTLSWRAFTLVSTAIIFSILLMQGRAALISIFLIALIRLGLFALRQSKRSPMALIGASACGLLAAAALSIAMPALFAGASDLLLINDPYRGIGSGFVGREARWDAGLSAFSENPFFGVGANYFESTSLYTPHNYFVFGLATMGGIGFSIFFGVIIYFFSRFAKSDPRSSLIFVGVTPLLIFNDRMLNMNPYPFLAYIILISFPLRKTILPAQNSLSVGLGRLPRARQPTRD